jgi:ribose/xylose/arabinose/galactoside ABC-type transport system permease subunit
MVNMSRQMNNIVMSVVSAVPAVVLLICRKGNVELAVTMVVVVSAVVAAVAVAVAVMAMVAVIFCMECLIFCGVLLSLWRS